MNRCYLSEIYGCADSRKEFTSAGPGRIRKINEASKRRQDTIHEDLEKKLLDDRNLVIWNYVSSYTSNYHINRHLKRFGAAGTSNEPPPTKCRRHSDIKLFDFRENSLFCRDPDPLHPNRWRKTLLCRTAERPRKQRFKETILEVCRSRNDKWSKEVELRIMGAISDLCAADARCHDDCRKTFTSPCSVEFASREPTEPVDSAFEAIVSELRSDQTRIWSSVEVHNSYTSFGGSTLSRRMFVKKIADVFDKELLVLLSSQGLAYIILFRTSKMLRIEELDEDDKSVEVVTKKIITRDQQE